VRFSPTLDQHTRAAVRPVHQQVAPREPLAAKGEPPRRAGLKIPTFHRGISGHEIGLPGRNVEYLFLVNDLTVPRERDLNVMQAVGLLFSC
jgi:hypothetical protein